MAVKRVLIKIGVIKTKRVKGYLRTRRNPEGTQMGIVQRKAHRRVQMCEFEQFRPFSHHATQGENVSGTIIVSGKCEYPQHKCIACSK